MSLKTKLNDRVAILKDSYKEAAATINEAYILNAEKLKDTFNTHAETLKPMGTAAVAKMKETYVDSAAKLTEVYKDTSEKLKETYTDSVLALNERAEELKPKVFTAARNARDFYVTHTNRTKRNFAIATERFQKQVRRKTLAVAQKAAINMTIKVHKMLHKMNKSQQRISPTSRSNS